METFISSNGYDRINEFAFYDNNSTQSEEDTDSVSNSTEEEANADAFEEMESMSQETTQNFAGSGGNISVRFESDNEDSINSMSLNVDDSNNSSDDSEGEEDEEDYEGDNEDVEFNEEFNKLIAIPEGVTRDRVSVSDSVNGDNQGEDEENDDNFEGTSSMLQQGSQKLSERYEVMLSPSRITALSKLISMIEEGTQNEGENYNISNSEQSDDDFLEMEEERDNLQEEDGENDDDFEETSSMLQEGTHNSTESHEEMLTDARITALSKLISLIEDGTENEAENDNISYSEQSENTFSEMDEERESINSDNQEEDEEDDDNSEESSSVLQEGSKNFIGGSYKEMLTDSRITALSKIISLIEEGTLNDSENDNISTSEQSDDDCLEMEEECDSVNGNKNDATLSSQSTSTYFSGANDSDCNSEGDINIEQYEDENEDPENMEESPRTSFNKLMHVLQEVTENFAQKECEEENEDDENMEEPPTDSLQKLIDVLQEATETWAKTDDDDDEETFASVHCSRNAEENASYNASMHVEAREEIEEESDQNTFMNKKELSEVLFEFEEDMQELHSSSGINSELLNDNANDASIFTQDIRCKIFSGNVLQHQRTSFRIEEFPHTSRTSQRETGKASREYDLSMEVDAEENAGKEESDAEDNDEEAKEYIPEHAKLLRKALSEFEDNLENDASQNASQESQGSPEDSRRYVLRKIEHLLTDLKRAFENDLPLRITLPNQRLWENCYLLEDR